MTRDRIYLYFILFYFLQFPMALITSRWDAYNSLKTTKKGNFFKVWGRGQWNDCNISTCRYGEPHPNFYVGTLEEALNEACHKPAKDVNTVHEFTQIA